MPTGYSGRSAAPGCGGGSSPRTWGGRVFLLIWLIGARLLGPGFDQLTPKMLIAGSYLWHLLVLPILLLIWLAVGILTTPLRLARWLRREHIEDPKHHVTASEAAVADLALEPETSISPSRRQFLGATFAATPPLVTAGAVAFSSATLNHFSVRGLSIAIPNLPRDLDGLRIAHVTDIHVGRFTDGPQLQDHSHHPSPRINLLFCAPWPIA